MLKISSFYYYNFLTPLKDHIQNVDKKSPVKSEQHENEQIIAKKGPFMTGFYDDFKKMRVPDRIKKTKRKTLS